VAKMKTLWLVLLLLHLLLSSLLEVTPKRATRAAAEASAISDCNGQQEAVEWTHIFLPSNYYSELNAQYYARFRRQSHLQLKNLRRNRPYPFEIALYI
ncbi:hypothetical protein KR222_008976, partial [Zaprionus bogoriensis]